MQTELVHIGFGNVLAINRVVAIVSPGSAPTKRLVQESKGAGQIIDMTSGRRAKAVLTLDSGADPGQRPCRAGGHRAGDHHPSDRFRVVGRGPTIVARG